MSERFFVFIFIHIGSILKTQISQGSVATCLGSGKTLWGFCCIAANLVLIVAVKNL